MAFVTTGLPNNGTTVHYQVSYDDSLPTDSGHDIAAGLLNSCEADFALMQSWFPGVNFKYAFPIYVQVTGQDRGGSWAVPPGNHPSVDLMPGPRPTTGLLRYILVAEVTEMFMDSQGRQWFAGADEGSMGEALSRFLASEFLSVTNTRSSIYPGYAIASLYLNDPLRPNFVDIAPDDIEPDFITGCGICFLFFLKYQLGFTIQQIITAAGGTLGSVHTALTGRTDGFTSFKALIDVHYPTIKHYFPPLDNVFPVADLGLFQAPPVTSWIVNAIPNIALLFLNHSIPVKVDVKLASDDTTLIELPKDASLSYSDPVTMKVKPQNLAFMSKDVALTATYAGKSLTAIVTVVRPSALPVAPLVIEARTANDPCAQQYVAGTPQDFVVKNPNVLLDHKGLTYKWTVVGAIPSSTTDPVLTIASLSPAGTAVSVSVEMKNASGITARGKLDFITAQPRVGLREDIRHLNCSLRNLKAINLRILPNIPVEEVELRAQVEQLDGIELSSTELVAAAERVVASAKAVRNSLKKR